ncbi:adhesive plaque matrix protein-like [Eleginops maclovinus]|uniref:adhesive plaque matrix protein-like n=1 Tax=Eleginops maclovinus TaxID=56733 RepID=UPI003080612D
MASQDSRDSKILLCLGLLLVAGSFSHCARLTKLKALDKLRGNSTTSSGQAKVSEQHHGRLLIGLFSREGVTKNLLDVDADYQDDMGWGEGYSKPNAERDSVAVDRLLKLEPKVECTGNSMRLEVQDAASTPGSLFFVDRGSRLSPLPLSKLPPSCGYTIKSSRRDLVLVAPYDGCFVALEEDCYVLPLRWCGLPVRMSCPIMKQSSPDPPMVTCHDQGMVVKTSWMVPVAKIGVKVNGNWEPLIKASARCGFSVVLHPEGVVISVHYAPCLDSKDGMYTLNLAGEGEIHISCPSLSPALMKNITQLNPSQSAVPKIPEKPDQGPEDIKGIKLPQPTTTPKPSPKTIPFVAPSAIQPETQVQQLFYPSFSYYPQPEKPTTAPEPEYPQGPVQQPFYPLPYYPQLKPFYPFPYDPQPKPEKPATAPETEKTTTGPEKPTAAPKPPQPDTPQSQVQWPSYPEPPKPDAPQGQVQHPFYPFPYYPQPGSEKPTTTQESEKPTKASKPPQPDTPQGQVQWPSYPFPYYPEAPQGQVQQPFYPFPYYPQPGPEKPTSSPEPKKPTAAPKPPRPDTPQGQVQWPYYPQPRPEKPTSAPEPEKPTAAPKPSQPEAPQGQVQKPFYPFPYYPQPEPGKPTTSGPEKPTAAPKPPQPDTPQGQVQWPSYPEPPKPDTPQGQVQHPFYPFPYYPQPRPEKPTSAPEPEKPTAAPKPSQPEAPQGQVQQPFYPFPYYPQPEPGKPTTSGPEKPTAVPKPPQPDTPQSQVQWPSYPEPPKPDTPQGQVQHPFYPFPYYPQPGPEKPTSSPEPEKPTAAPKPSQPEAPQGQVQQPFYPFPYYPQPGPEKPTSAPEPEKPTAAPKPSQPEAPQGQVQQPFYPFPYYPQPEPGKPTTSGPEKPTAAPKPPQPDIPQSQVQWPSYPEPPKPETPQGQVQHPFYPFPYYPQPGPEKPTSAPEPEKPSAAPKPSQPEAPQGQVQQPFYPFPYYPQPEPGKPTTSGPEKPTAAPKPPQPGIPQSQVQWPSYPEPPKPEAPQGQVQHPFYPFPYYPQPGPEKPTSAPEPEKPSAAPKPSQPEAPQGQVQQPFYPFPYYPQPEPGKPTTPGPEKSTAAPRPQLPEAPQGQVQQPFYPFPYYPQPEPEKATDAPKQLINSPLVTLTPATNLQQPQQVITGTSVNSQETAILQSSNGAVTPQAHSPGLLYRPPAYCRQFCPSGLPNCCPQIAFHQHLHQIVPAGLGSPDSPSFHSGLPFVPQVAYSGFSNGLGFAPLPPKPTETTTIQHATTTSLPIPQFRLQKHPLDDSPAAKRDNVINPTNPEWSVYPYSVPGSPYPNLPQGQLPFKYNVPSKPQASGNEPVNQMLQYKPRGMSYPSEPNYMSHFGQYLQHKAKRQNVLPAKELQSSNKKARLSEGPMHPEPDHLLVPYYILQDAQAQTYDKSRASGNTSQPYMTRSKKFIEHEQTVHSSEPKSYVLLQHGPPGRESDEKPKGLKQLLQIRGGQGSRN